MDFADPPGLSTALLRWINSFKLPQEIASWRDLQDGHVLWKILAEVEPEYFAGQLPEQSASSTDNWIPKWQNLKHINKLVMSYITDECGRLAELSKRMNPDLKAIAIDASAEDSTQLLRAVLLAAMYSPVTNARMVEVMQELGAEVAFPIAEWIGNMEQADRKLAEAEGHMDTDSDAGTMMSPARVGTPQTSGLARDSELEHEEQVIKLYKTISKLEERSQVVSSELDEARKHIAALEEELNETKYQLEQGGQSSANKQFLDQLQQDSTREKDHIAALEQELGWYKSQTESQEKQLDRLKLDSDSRQGLRDELQMIKVERDDLLQKAKANENLKKKIQTLQESDKSNLTLRQDFEAAEQELKTLRPLKDKISALQRAAEESVQTVSNVEQQLYEASQSKRRLDSEIKSLSARLSAERDRQQKDAHTIREQEERIQELEADGGGGTTTMDNLDEELSTTDKSLSDLKSKLAAVELENKTLQATKDTMNEGLLDKEAQQTLQDRNEKLEKRYLQVYQDNLGLEATLKGTSVDLHEYVGNPRFTQISTDLQSSTPYVELRSLFESTSAELDSTKQNLDETETMLANTKVQRETAESKVRAMDKDKSEALDELKRANTTGTEILQSENSRLVQLARRMKNESEEQKSLLRHSLLNKVALAMENPEIRSKNEFKLIASQLKSLLDSPQDLDGFAMTLAQRIEDIQADVVKADAKAAEAMTAQEAEIEDLKSRLRKAEDEAAKGVKSPLQENLQRELSLMTSAWYDITNRMQSDAVVVQRRSEAPRSFLNKQRRLVSNPAIAMRR